MIFVHDLFVNIATAFPEATVADPSPDRDDWHEPMLKELAEIGMELARVLLRREAAKADDEEAGPNPQLAFARVSRAVRQTVALNTPLRQQRQAGAAKAGVAPVDGAPMDQARLERVRARVEALCRKSEVAGRLKAAIEIETAEGDRERLLADLDRRLDVAVNGADFAERSIEAVVADIRHGLGLGPKPAAATVAVDDDEDLDDEGLDDEDRDDDEPGESAEPPWLEPGWGTAPSRPRRGSG